MFSEGIESVRLEQMSQCEQIRRSLRICLHSRQKSLMKKFYLLCSKTDETLQGSLDTFHSCYSKKLPLQFSNLIYHPCFKVWTARALFLLLDKEVVQYYFYWHQHFLNSGAAFLSYRTMFSKLGYLKLKMHGSFLHNVKLLYCSWQIPNISIT